jgi:hypothetical protein
MRDGGMMNIYEKLNAARVAFQSRGVKMSGKNTFAGYGYYELGDILPAINAMACEIGFICEVSFAPELATLTVRDTEKPQDVIVFTSPMSSASLKGCHEVQNLGAVETYIKRYLYQNAFEIVESDQVNKTHNPDAPTVQDQCAKLSADLKLTDAEKKELWESSGKNYSNLLIQLKVLNAEKGNV